MKLWVLGLLVATPLAAQDSVRVSVRIEGVTAELERNVRAVMGLARAAQEGKLPPARITQLYHRGEADIARALRPFGYYEPRVSEALESGPDGWTALFVIDPGPAVQVRDVRIDLQGPAAQHPAFQRERAEFPLHPGDTLRDQLYEAGKLAFLATASDSGYLDAGFDTSTIIVNRDTRSADIRLRFRTGPRFRFGTVAFEQKVLDEGFLRSRVPFDPGDVYQHAKLLELQNALAEDPYFARVEVLPLRQEARNLEVPVRVILEPRPRWTYEFGAGYGTNTGPRGRANGMWRLINERGHFAQAELLLSAVEQQASAQYNIPAVLHPTGRLTFFAGFARMRVAPEEITSRTYTAGVRLARQRIGWREMFSLAYQRATFEIGTDSNRTALLIPGVTWERTRSDSRILPRRGLRTRLEVQASQKGFLATASFVQIRGSAKLVLGFLPGFRLLTRAELGRTFTSQFAALPPTIRFFTGGDETVRGFRYLSLGPRDSLGTVLGGAALVVAGAEVDYQLAPRWLIAGFTDAGNAMTRLSLADLARSVGGGIRFVSPLGLLRLDLAFPVSRHASRLRLHLSMGPDL